MAGFALPAIDLPQFDCEQGRVPIALFFDHVDRGSIVVAIDFEKMPDRIVAPKRRRISSVMARRELGGFPGIYSKNSIVRVLGKITQNPEKPGLVRMNVFYLDYSLALAGISINHMVFIDIVVSSRAIR